MTARIDEIADRSVPHLGVRARTSTFSSTISWSVTRSRCCFTPACAGCFRRCATAVATVIDPAQLRWIRWSHFEVDECGALNEWLAVGPERDARRAASSAR